MEEQYLGMMGRIHKDGSKRMDRTGTGTSAIFGPQMSHNLSLGEFPALTTKKIFLRGIIEELLWLIRKDTNIQYLTDRNVHIWDQWALNKTQAIGAYREGDLGPIYGAAWGRVPNIRKNKFVQIKIPEVPEEVDSEGEWYGVATTKGSSTSTTHPLVAIWIEMIAKCYDKSEANGYYVCEEWLSFDGFAKDVSCLPLYEEWQQDPDEFFLSCDYFGVKCFSRLSTVFAPREFADSWHNAGGLLFVEKDKDDNIVKRSLWELPENLRGNSEPIPAKPGHIWRQSLYIDQFADVMDSLANRSGSRRHVVSAWIPQYLPDETISPQENVLEGRAALATCHCLFQFFVEEMTVAERMYYREARKANKDGFTDISHLAGVTYDEAQHELLDNEGFPRQRLSCKLYQRSADVPLGVPFNIASYAMLTMMMAQQLDMLEGDFIHSFGDTHIYSNQMDGVVEQLKRRPRQAPTLKIVNRPKDIYSYSAEDFELVDYNPHPKIEFDISV